MDTMNWSVDVRYESESSSAVVSIDSGARCDDALEAFTRLARVVGYSQNAIEESILNLASEIQARRDASIIDELDEEIDEIVEFTDPGEDDMKTWTRRVYTY